MMTGKQLKAARYAISRAVGEKISQSDMAAICGLLDPGGNGKTTIRKWEEGLGPSGPVGTLIDLILEGVHPDVSGFFINHVRERPRDVPFYWFAGRSPLFIGRRQPSRDGTSRMMREYPVRICEGLGVKFPGPTRQKRRFDHRTVTSGPPPTPGRTDPQARRDVCDRGKPFTPMYRR
jgi:hypothetical protein